MSRIGDLNRPAQKTRILEFTAEQIIASKQQGKFDAVMKYAEHGGTKPSISAITHTAANTTSTPQSQSVQVFDEKAGHYVTRPVVVANTTAVATQPAPTTALAQPVTPRTSFSGGAQQQATGSATAFTPQANRPPSSTPASAAITTPESQTWHANLTRDQRHEFNKYSGEEVIGIQQSGKWELFKNTIVGIPQAGKDYLAGVDRGAKNFGKDTFYDITHPGETAYGIANAIAHPIQTASAIKDEIVGGGKNYYIAIKRGDAGSAGEIAGGTIAGAAATVLVPEVRIGGAIRGSTGIIERANFAQRNYSRSFDPNGAFAGRTIDDVANALRSGQIATKDVQIQYIVREGNTLILNTRSAQALEQAGIPRGQWNVVNMTGDVAAESRLSSQLQGSGLSNEGTPSVVPR